MLVQIFVPRFIGFAVTFCATVLGQLVASVLFDSLGLVGMDVVPISWSRILGVLAAMVGTTLVALQFDKTKIEEESEEEPDEEDSVSESSLKPSLSLQSVGLQ